MTLYGTPEAIDAVRVLHTPGHSPGHLAFWWPERKGLIAGDAVATYPTQHRTSLERMVGLDSEVPAVGHGDPITAGAAVRLRSLLAGM